MQLPGFRQLFISILLGLAIVAWVLWSPILPVEEGEQALVSPADQPQVGQIALPEQYQATSDL